MPFACSINGTQNVILNKSYSQVLKVEILILDLMLQSDLLPEFEPDLMRLYALHRLVVLRLIYLVTGTGANFFRTANGCTTSAIYQHA